MTVAALALMVAMQVLGRVGVESVRCEVVGASASQGQRAYNAGWRVLVETEDCRTIVYPGGATADDAEQVAGMFTPGTYEFDMSLLSRLAAHGYVPGLSPDADEHRRVG